MNVEPRFIREKTIKDNYYFIIKVKIPSLRRRTLIRKIIEFLKTKYLDYKSMNHKI